MANGGQYTFRAAWLHAVVVLATLNLVDLLVVDWLIGMQWRPKMMILPGTEGLRGYDDMRFHVRGFVIGLAGTVAVSPIIGAIAVLAQAILSGRT